VLVVADPARTGALDELDAELPQLELPPAGGGAGEPVEIPVSYDGADLPEVARLTGLEAEEVVRRHTAPEYTVAFLGFSPGFPYLVGLDPALEVPRRDTPRTSIPAGSVGLAGGQTGIYPTASPGGWQLIGRTQVTLFDPHRDPPAPPLRAPAPRRRSRGGGGPGPASRGCSPPCRTWAGRDWPIWAYPPPGRPTGVPSAWPTGWAATNRGGRRWRSPWRGRSWSWRPAAGSP